MAQKLAKKTIDIRAKLKVKPESLEAQIDEYLKDTEAIPYEKHKLIIDALRTYYLPLVRENQGADPERLRQSLIDADRAWQIHFMYLQQRLGIDVTQSPSSSSSSTSASIPQPKRKPEPETKPQSELEEEYVHIFDLS